MLPWSWCLITAINNQLKCQPKRSKWFIFGFDLIFISFFFSSLSCSGNYTQALKALLCWLYLTRLVFEDNLSTQYCISTLKSFSESFTGATECRCVQQNTLLPQFISWAAWICNYKDNLSVSGELEWMAHTSQHKGQAVERERGRIEVTCELRQWAVVISNQTRPSHTACYQEDRCDTVPAVCSDRLPNRALPSCSEPSFDI